MLTLLLVLVSLLYLKWIVFVLMLPVIRVVRARSRRYATVYPEVGGELNSITPPPNECKEEAGSFWSAQTVCSRLYPLRRFPDRTDSLPPCA